MTLLMRLLSFSYPFNVWRLITLLTSLLLWGTLACKLVTGRIAVRTNRIDSYGAYWSLAILVVLAVLVIIHILLQQIARHMEYVFFLLNIVLFVSSATVLTSLGVAFVTGEQFAPWVIPVSVLGMLTVMLCLLGQVVALKSARENYHREVERIIWSRAAAGVTAVQTRALVYAAKHMMPLDFSPHASISLIAKYPELWQDLAELLRQHGIDWKEEDFYFVRGLSTPGAKGNALSYFFFGWIGTWTGSLTILLGTIALGGQAA